MREAAHLPVSPSQSDGLESAVLNPDGDLSNGREEKKGSE
jgi:hypothetical protein